VATSACCAVVSDAARRTRVNYSAVRSLAGRPLFDLISRQPTDRRGDVWLHGAVGVAAPWSLSSPELRLISRVCWHLGWAATRGSLGTPRHGCRHWRCMIHGAVTQPARCGRDRDAASTHCVEALAAQSAAVGQLALCTSTVTHESTPVYFSRRPRTENYRKITFHFIAYCML